MRIAQVHAKEMLRVKSLSSARRRRWQRWSEIQPTPFRQVYNFILKAVNGNKATADAVFEDYLAGKLSEELLSISRRRVSADQAGSSNGEIERVDIPRSGFTLTSINQCAWGERACGLACPLGPSG
jgi:hypothetical protein